MSWSLEASGSALPDDGDTHVQRLREADMFNRVKDLLGQFGLVAARFTGQQVSGEFPEPPPPAPAPEPLTPDEEQQLADLQARKAATMPVAVAETPTAEAAEPAAEAEPFGSESEPT